MIPNMLGAYGEWAAGTMQDPPRFDVRALPLIAGIIAALLGLARVRPFDRLPLGAVALCLAGLIGSLRVDRPQPAPAG